MDVLGRRLCEITAILRSHQEKEERILKLARHSDPGVPMLPPEIIAPNDKVIGKEEA